MAQYLLIHGAFRGAWAWEAVVEALSAHGHTAIAIDLPYAGESWVEDHPVVTLADYVDATIEAAREMGTPVVVGHSQGGFVAGCAVGQSPEAFTGLAYLDAPMPQAGKRAIDLRSPAAEAMQMPELDPLADVPPMPVTAEHDLTSEQAEWINARLTPQPIGPSLVPVAAIPPAGYPTAVAFCEHSHPMVPARGSRAILDAMGGIYEVFATHHDAPVTAPSTVASWLANQTAW
ncbi:MAG: alpha/beta fold hydrolase [Acidimicrobiia bacterium]